MQLSIQQEKEKSNFVSLEIVTPIQYWAEITENISHFLKQNSIVMADCYLVGSGISNQSIIDVEDVDCAIILSKNYSDKELLYVRDILDSLILKIDTFNKFHFRLFDSDGFQNLADYDGYRLYEFQVDNLSFNDSDILFQSKPNLSSDNFNLSYLTQLVYDCLMNQDIFEFRTGNKKSEDRLKRNFEINAINGILLDANGESKMKNEFSALRNKLNQSQSDWNNFLEIYFKRMKHEYINKSNRYNLNLKKYLCQQTA